MHNFGRQHFCRLCFIRIIIFRRRLLVYLSGCLKAYDIIISFIIITITHIIIIILTIIFVIINLSKYTCYPKMLMINIIIPTTTNINIITMVIIIIIIMTLVNWTDCFVMFTSLHHLYYHYPYYHHHFYNHHHDPGKLHHFL